MKKTTVLATVGGLLLVGTSLAFGASSYYTPGGASISCANTPSFNAQKKVTSCVLNGTSSYYTPGGASISCKAKTVINFNPSGKVTSCTLAGTSSYYTPGGASVSCKSGTVINFNNSGKVPRAHWQEIPVTIPPVGLPYPARAAQ